MILARPWFLREDDSRGPWFSQNPEVHVTKPAPKIIAKPWFPRYHDSRETEILRENDSCGTIHFRETKHSCENLTFLWCQSLSREPHIFAKQAFLRDHTLLQNYEACENHPCSRNCEARETKHFCGTIYIHETQQSWNQIVCNTHIGPDTSKDRSKRV